MPEEAFAHLSAKLCVRKNDRLYPSSLGKALPGSGHRLLGNAEGREGLHDFSLVLL